MKIIVYPEMRKRLVKEMGVTKAVVSLALNFHQHGLTSRRIRHLAMNKYGGALMV